MANIQQMTAHFAFRGAVAAPFWNLSALTACIDVQCKPHRGSRALACKAASSSWGCCSVISIISTIIIACFLVGLQNPVDPKHAGSQGHWTTIDTSLGRCVLLQIASNSQKQVSTCTLLMCSLGSKL